MTSNGNTVQKLLIEILTKTHQNPQTAYEKAYKKAKTQDKKQIITRIYYKLVKTTNNE